MLEISRVSGGYGGVTVLRDLSISVPDASVVALIGPNGAGKTTTLKMVSGLLRPVGGEILLDGRPITQISAADRVQLGVCHLIEGRGVFPSLTVQENLILFSSKGRETESIQRATTAFPFLGARRKQQAGTLSGGEQQILAIVRAYLCDPKLVIVDEASLGLAPRIVDQVFEFLRTIAREGISLLLVEQYVNRALALADSVYVMHRGEVVFSGASAGLSEEQLFSLYAGDAA